MNSDQNQKINLDEGESRKLHARLESALAGTGGSEPIKAVLETIRYHAQNHRETAHALLAEGKFKLAAVASAADSTLSQLHDQLVALTEPKAETRKEVGA